MRTAGGGTEQETAEAVRALLVRAAEQAARLTAMVRLALEQEAFAGAAGGAASAAATGAASVVGPAESTAAEVARPAGPRDRLTARERQVLDLIAEGLSSKEIARALTISRATARCHAQNVLTKLGVDSRARAAVLAAPMPEVAAPVAPGRAAGLETLTRREAEILRALATGLPRREIAERLYVSPHTVRTHIQRVLAKLEVHSALGATALARKAGWVSP
jgi:DNA-binding NarL/FixJ family response regulator